MAFELLDYIIFFGMLIMSASIGMYFRLTGGRQKTNEEFMLGNRKQNPICVAVSLMASFMSAISIVGGAAEAYLYGTQFFTINLGNSLGIALSLILYIPTFYKLKTVSVFQYLELRFGYVTRLCASLITTIQMLLYISIALVAPAISLQTITKLSHEASIISCGFVCLFYAALGGMKAIILTDVIQSLFMFGSMLAVIFAGYSRLGSFQQIFIMASQRGRIEFFNFSANLTVRHTWWSTIIGGTISGIVLNGINQTQVQRYLTMKDYRTVVIAALSSAPIITALSLCVCMSGLTLFAIYADCDPVKSGKIPSGDHILPYYVTNELHHFGLSGIFAAGVFSASLSTISPILNSLAVITFEDYLMPLMKRFNYSRAKPESSFYSQIFTILYGIMCILISLLALHVTTLLQAALIIFQLVGGPMLGTFSLGMFTSTANQKGTLVGFFVSLICVTWLCLAPKPNSQKLATSVTGCVEDILINNTSAIVINSVASVISAPNREASLSVFSYMSRISYLYYGLVGFMITFVLGYIFSLIFRDEKFVDVNLLHTTVAKPLLKKCPLQTLKNLEPLARVSAETQEL